MNARWDCVTRPESLSASANEVRHRIESLARDHAWDSLLAELTERSTLINSPRLDDGSLYAPLHQAAYAAAPSDVIERLLALGAWRTLLGAQGERPVDVARARGHLHLVAPLEPVYLRHVPPGVLAAIQQHFHELIRETAGALIDEHSLRLPQLSTLLEMDIEHPRTWCPIPGMYGGFSYQLERDGDDALLLVESFSRVVTGSARRHEINAQEIRLRDAGFV